MALQKGVSIPAPESPRGAGVVPESGTVLPRRTFLKVSGSSAAVALGTLAAAGSGHVHAGARRPPPAGAREAPPLEALRRVPMELPAPPHVVRHEQAASGDPVVVQVRLTAKEARWNLDETGAEVWALTYDGSIPGPLIVCHQDDYVELTLVKAGVDYGFRTGGRARRARGRGCPRPCTRVARAGAVRCRHRSGAFVSAWLSPPRRECRRGHRRLRGPRHRTGART